MLDFLDWLATLLDKVACLFPSCPIGFGLLVYVMDFFLYNSHLATLSKEIDDLLVHM